MGKMYSDYHDENIEAMIQSGTLRKDGQCAVIPDDTDYQEVIDVLIRRTIDSINECLEEIYRKSRVGRAVLNSTAIERILDCFTGLVHKTLMSWGIRKSVVEIKQLLRNGIKPKYQITEE